MIADKAVEVLETTRLMFEISLDDSDCDEDSAEAREDNEETVEAINEAIKALERQPCTDAISREEALKEMQKYHDDCAKTSEYTRLGFETAMNVVRELPPVTPERPNVNDVLDKIRAEINSPNRNTCDYFIVDRIEKIINEYQQTREG